MNHERFVSFCLYAGARSQDYLQIAVMSLKYTNKKKEQWPMMKYQHLDDSK